MHCENYSALQYIESIYRALIRINKTTKLKVSPLAARDIQKNKAIETNILTF